MSLLSNSMLVANAVKTYAIWDTANKDALITLSGGSLIATRTSGSAGIYKAVKSTIGKSSGKHYIELTCSHGTDDGIGVAKQAVSNAASPGVSADGYIWFNNSIKQNNNTTAGYGTSWTTHVLGVLLDMDAGTITMRRNNVDQGIMYSGLTGTFYVAFCSGSNFHAITANFGAAAFTYAVPSGYNAGLYN